MFDILARGVDQWERWVKKLDGMKYHGVRPPAELIEDEKEDFIGEVNHSELL